MFLINKRLNKAVIENRGTLKSVPDCYKNQKICNKAVNNQPRALEFVPGCCKTQKMCDKAHPLTIKYVSEFYKTQEMCYRTVHSLNLFLINVKLKKYVTELFLYILFNSIFSC